MQELQSRSPVEQAALIEGSDTAGSQLFAAMVRHVEILNVIGIKSKQGSNSIDSGTNASSESSVVESRLYAAARV